jgi:ABC-type cobalamin/Fe3+-siderophores transport system ATPase subunit
MANHFQFDVPRSGETNLQFTLGIGEVLYLLGANGTGKSSLVSRLFSSHRAEAKRISAHRQTWFHSNTVDMTAANRANLETNIRSHDAQEHARYRLDDPGERASIAIYDLINMDTMLARKIADLVRAGNTAGAEDKAKQPAPLQIINDLMRLSNIPIEINIEEGQKIVARKNGGSGYSIAELSDGERNAFLIAADVLTAKSGTLLLIDEPERHLHRAIISPLLKLLFDKRKDCAFIVSTHELMLPLDTSAASTLLLRSCEYENKTVKAWTLDLLEPGAPINEELKGDLLGARRTIIFVEGTAKSLDAPLYSLLFPQVSIIPKEACRDVEHAVRGLRGAAGMHWVSAWGIIDNDQRSPEDVARLRTAGVWALPHYSVEGFYYHPKVLARIAERQAALLGGTATALLKPALASAVTSAKLQKEHLVAGAILRLARRKVLTGLPTRETIVQGAVLRVEVDIAALHTAEEIHFDGLISAADWEGLLTRYPLRESKAFDAIVTALKFPDKNTYRAAALKLLQDEPAAVAELRDLLGDLYSAITADITRAAPVADVAA